MEKRNVMEVLFGSLFPEGVISDSPKYEAVNQAAITYSMALNDHLEPEQRLLWDQYTEALAQVADIQNLECFRQGFLLGLRITLEVVKME